MIPKLIKLIYYFVFVCLLFSNATPLYSQDKSEIYNLKLESVGTDIASYNSNINLCKVYWNYSFDSSIIYARRAIVVSKLLENDSLGAVADIYLALSFSYIDRIDSVVHYCNIAISRSLNYPHIKAKAMTILGVAYRKQGDFKQGLEFGNKSIELYKELHDSINYAEALGNVSTTLQEMGDPGKAIDYSLAAARIFKSLYDSVDLAKRYGTIANIYLDLGNSKMGIKYYAKGIALVDSTENKWLYMNFIFNIATVYHDLHTYDSAITNYSVVLKYYLSVNDREGIALANQNIGLALLGKEEYKKAINYLLTGYDMFAKLSTVRNISDVLSDLGLAYYKINKLDSAKYFLNMAVDSALKYDLVREESKAYEILYRIFKKSGEYEKSLRSYEKYKNLSDSIYSESIKDKIAVLNSKYETELKDQKIKQLILDDKINQAKTRTYIISVSLFLVIVILVITILYSEKRTQARLLLVKGKLLQKEKNELDKELEYKKKQLTSHALHMTQKNKILQEIRKAVNDVLPDIPDHTKIKIKGLQMELNKSLRYDKDWEVFSMYFHELNKDFFDKLLKINDNLSQNDLRLSALLRMNMNIKEAAAVLNIEPDSVKTARYKLRKKLGLKVKEDLIRFIIGL